MVAAVSGVETSVEQHGARVRFLVAVREPAYAERLLHMGYLPAEDGQRFATRWFAASAAAPRYYERFAASIEWMVLQSARLVPVPWQEALREAVSRLNRSGLTCGSTEARRWLFAGSKSSLETSTST